MEYELFDLFEIKRLLLNEVSRLEKSVEEESVYRFVGVCYIVTRVDRKINMEDIDLFCIQELELIRELILQEKINMKVYDDEGCSFYLSELLEKIEKSICIEREEIKK